MPKMKSHRGAAKRFKVTSTGKIMRRKAGMNHILEKKPSKVTRRLNRETQVSGGDLDQRPEGLRVGDGEVGEHLAVDLDTGRVQAVDEPAVAHALHAGRSVDALDPQRPEVALAGPPVAVGVLQGVHDLLVGGLVRAALVAVVALRLLEDDAAVLLAVDGALHPCHEGSSFRVGVRGWWSLSDRGACGPAPRRRR